jgi:hypothetical protein
VIEPVADPAVMAIQVDSLDCAAEHAGSAKPKHSPPCVKPALVKICGRFAAAIATWTLEGYSCYRQAISVNPSAVGSNKLSSGTMQ